MDNQSKKKYSKFAKLFLDTNRLENPGADSIKEVTTVFQKLIGWIIFFLVTHAWWIIAAVVSYYCEGALGVGYRCSIPIESIAELAEISVIFFGIPVLLPVLFYSVLYKKIKSSTK